MNNSKFSMEDLKGRSYRDLQKLAKSLELPSNVKKIYLIELIHARKYENAEKVENIVYKVKLERQQQSQIRKFCTRKYNHPLGPKKTSTCSLLSPSINSTPKRPRYPRVQYSPNDGSYQPHSLLRSTIRKNKITLNSLNAVKNSDRVLRSCNQRLFKNITSENSIIKVIKNGNSMISKPINRSITSICRDEKLNILCNDNGYPKLNFTQCVVKKRKACIQSSHCNMVQNECSMELVPVVTRMNQASQTNLAFKPTKILNGVYPVLNKETPNVNYEYIQSIGVRRNDGTISKINAVVLKNMKKIPNPQNYNYRNIEMTVQDLINSNIHSHKNRLESIIPPTPRTPYSTTCTITRPEVGNLDIVDGPAPFSRQQDDLRLHLPNQTTSRSHLPNHTTSRSHFKELAFSNVQRSLNSQKITYTAKPNDIRSLYKQQNSYTAVPNNFAHDADNYYHKNTRNDISLGMQRNYEKPSMLPRINEVFTKFNDVTKPIYVQVSDQSERMISYPIYSAAGVGGNTTNVSLLENLYNFKNQFLVNQPLLQIATKANTKCVFTASTITTAKEQTTNIGDAYMFSSCELDNHSADEDFDLHDANEQRLLEDKLNASEATVSLDCNYDFCISPDRASQATIPEMVEDALEYISQDGDYIQRLGMDIRMQCILCTWAGPRFILDHHIRTCHPNQLLRQEKGEWNLTYTLGGLVQQRHWLSHVVEYGSELYILSVKYEDPDFFLVSFATLATEGPTKTGTVTIYNKVTGEPYSWSGEIHILPPSLPYYTDSVCLKLEISSLNLLPNSANLKLINKELVIESPSKVVVGNPELNDIHIILFVSVLD